MDEPELEAWSQTYDAISKNWPGATARERQTPPPHKGKPAFWWLGDVRKADLGTLMQSAKAMADDAGGWGRP